MKQKQKQKHKQGPKQPRIMPVPEQERADSIVRLLGPGAGGAADLAKETFAPGSLGRISTERTQEEQDLLNQQRALAAFYGPGGAQRSAEMQEFLSRQKAGLDGYTAAENTAMREQAGREGDAAYANQLAQLAKSQVRGGVRGPAATAQTMALARAKAAQDAQLSQDLMVQNADEKQRRLAAYGQSLGGVEGEEFGRGQQAIGSYGQSLGASRQDELARQQYNQSQMAAEKAGYLNTLYGGTDLYNQRRTADRNFKLSKQMTNIAKRQLRRGGGGGPDYQGYAGELTKLL